MSFFDFWTEAIAIDLGTANTLIIHNDKVVVDSPSIVAIDQKSGKIIAVGKEANMMHGNCLLYTSPSPRDLSTSRMPSSA